VVVQNLASGLEETSEPYVTVDTAGIKFATPQRDATAVRL